MFHFFDENTQEYIKPSASNWKANGPLPYTMPSDRLALDFKKLDPTEFSLWRYRDLLNLSISEEDWRATTMGEGCTALVAAGNHYPNLQFKMEFAMPTLSFKDRGVAVMLAQARGWGVEEVVVDSSGNAATSVAAYASRLGMSAKVFVPNSTSMGKLQQAKAHGADVQQIAGSREDTADATFEYLARNDAFYASHIFNPLFHEGTRTMIYEIWEQSKSSLPQEIYLPVGNGTMLLGAIDAIMHLRKHKYIVNIPKIIAVQAFQCAPIYKSFVDNAEQVNDVKNLGTVAEGIAIASPARGTQILKKLRQIKAEMIVVTDEEVLRAMRTLASLGFYVEPTACASFAAFTKRGSKKSSIVPLCGAGLKYKPE